MPKSEITLAAVESAAKLTLTSLGELWPLPSDIENNVFVGIKPANNHYSAGLQEIAVGCVVKSRQREIAIHTDYQNHEHAPGPTQTVTTPRLLFLFVSPLVTSENDNHGYVGDDVARGYCFRYHHRKTLTEALKHVGHYFFPHVYHSDGYMCVTYSAPNRRDTPRKFNNYFWSCYFTGNWLRLYGRGQFVALTDKGKHRFLSTLAYHDYQKSYCSALDVANREFLSSVKVFFETATKPLAVFMSRNPEVIEAVKEKNPDNIMSWTETDGYTGTNAHKSAVLGFAFPSNNGYWIMLKDRSFISVTSEQVKVK